MNLHFRPTVMFENSWPFPTSYLKNIRWEIHADPIGSLAFDVEYCVDSPFEIQNDKNFIEFDLTRKNVLFQHDDYECKIIFSALFDYSHSSFEINEIFWGMVKTRWSKGLR